MISTIGSAQSKFTTEFVESRIATIDNNLPVVASIFSNNTASIYPFGLGDIIDIYVEMTYDVSVLTTPTLEMKLEGKISYAEYIYPSNYTSGDPIRTLHFQYSIVPGDIAAPLDYTSVDALVGDIRRWTALNPILIANLKLPGPGDPGSISYCCNILIQSAPPHVDSIVPLKRAGIYGTNENIVILVRFTKPVKVHGNPKLEVVTSKTTVGEANFVANPIPPSRIALDVPLDLRPTDVLFNYVIKSTDNVLSLYHSGPDAIKADGIFVNGTCSGSGNCIVHDTMNPQISADMLLRKYGDFEPVNGLLQRQWKFRFAQKIEVLIRDMYHTQPQTLSATIEHLGRTATLFNGVGEGKTFGKSFPGARLGNNRTVTRPNYRFCSWDKYTCDSWSCHLSN